MSFFAIDPDTGETHDVEWFLLNKKSIGICPVCDSNMELRAESSVSTAAHFWHGIGATCPSIKKNRKRYDELPSSSLDELAGEILRNEVRDNLYLIYQSCNAIVDGLKYKEFKELVAKATDKKIWDYVGLQLNYVPYVLVTFQEMFYAKGSTLRDEKYYVVLEPSVRCLDDLWNKPQLIKQFIWKVSPDKGVIETVSIKSVLDPTPGWFKEASRKINL